MKNILALLFLSTSLTVFGQEKPNITYQKAYEELHQMLRGNVPVSFKRAVFVTENAYLDNQWNYDSFLNQIDELVALSKAVAATDGLKYEGKDRQQILLSWSIFRVIKDSLFFEDTDKKQISWKRPYTYDLEDSWGERNWTKMFVSKLLYTQTGNCHSLPALYRILADELGVKAYLALAPNHTYIKQWNDKTGWYNTELTNGQFPFDADIKWNSYIKTEAIADGIYMDTLSAKDNIAYIMTDLAEGYLRKFAYTDVETPLAWLETVLNYYPNYINALILKAELQKLHYEQLMKESGVTHFSKLWKEPTLKTKFAELEQSYFQINKLGYRRMPKEMYLNWLFRVKKDTTRKPYEFASPQPFKKFNYNVQVVTGGNGQNFEFFDQEEVVRIGTVELNRLTGKITKFIDTLDNEIPDEVIGRMYDPALGKWWQQDPLAEEFYNASPYNFDHNNPINFIDPDGRAPIGVGTEGPARLTSTFVGPDGNVIKHIDDNDHNIYFVNNVATWDGSKSGLPILGQEAPGVKYDPGKPVGFMFAPPQPLATGAVDPDYTIEGIAIPLFSWMKYLKFGKYSRGLWGFWDDYAKIMYKGREYAKVGNRLFTRHAVDRMAPSGLGKAAGGEAGRSIAPAFIEDAINNGSKTFRLEDGVVRTIHESGTLRVVTEEGGKIVVTAITKSN